MPSKLPPGLAQTVARRQSRSFRGKRSAPSALPRGEAMRIAIAAERVIAKLSATVGRDVGPALLRFFGEHAELFNFLPFTLDDVIDPEEGYREGQLTALRRAILEARLNPRPNALDRRVDWLRRIAGLTAPEAELIRIGTRAKLFEEWSNFLDAAADQRRGSAFLQTKVVAPMLGYTARNLHELVLVGGRLVRTGLIEDHRDGDFSVSDLLVRLMRMGTSRPEQLEAALLRASPPCTLEWDDFEHLPQRDLAARTIEHAIARRKGINILLHGAPGTGKSEFARALSDRLGLSACFVGEADDEGGEPTRSERLAHFTMVRALTTPGAQRLIVIDEADDMMISPFGRDRQSNSKLWLNQIVESSATPTVWIVNDAEVLGPAVIRRMSLAIAFELPPPRIRARVAERHAARLGVMLAEGEAARIGGLRVAPAVTAGALQVAYLSGGGTATALSAARSIQRALGREQEPERGPDTQFNPALSRASEDLVVLEQRLAGILSYAQSFDQPLLEQWHMRAEPRRELLCVGLAFDPDRDLTGRIRRGAFKVRLSLSGKLRRNV